MTVRPAGSRRPASRPCISVEPVAVVDGGQDARVRAQEGLVLDLEVLGRASPGSPGRPAPAIVWSPVGDILVDGDRRERRRVDLVRARRSGSRPCRARRARGPASRRRRSRRPSTRTTRPRSAPTRQHAASEPAPARAAGREPAARTRRRSSAADRGSGRSRSRSGRAAQTTTRPGEQPDLGPELVGLGRHQERAGDRRRGGRTRSARRGRPGTVFGSVIMKNRKIRTSGEVTITRQKSTPQTGANAQFAVMQWPEAARIPIADRQRHPERRGQGEQVQAPGDQQPAAR